MATSKILTVGALSGKGVYLNPLTNKIELRLKSGSGLSLTTENELTFSGEFLTSTTGQTLIDTRIAEKVKDASTTAKGIFRLASSEEVQALAGAEAVPTVTDVNAMIVKSVKDIPTNTSMAAAISKAIEAIPAPTIAKASATQDGLLSKEHFAKIESLAAASGNVKDIEDKINTSLQTALAKGGSAHETLTTAIQDVLTTKLADYVQTTALTKALEPYAKTAALSDYVLTTALTTALEPYAKTTALADYVQTTALNTTLESYVKTTALTTALEPYAKTTALDTLATKESLKDYVKTTELSEKVLALADVTIQDSNGSPLAKAFPA